MKLFRKLTNLRHYAHVLAISGPVGLVFALRLERLQRRQARVKIYIEREKELHRDHMAALKYEHDNLVDAKQALIVSASQYWTRMRQLEQQRRLRDIAQGSKP